MTILDRFKAEATRGRIQSVPLPLISAHLTGFVVGNDLHTWASTWASSSAASKANQGVLLGEGGGSLASRLQASQDQATLANSLESLFASNHHHKSGAVDSVRDKTSV